MYMDDKKRDDHDEMLSLIRENSILIKENNFLLKKLYRYSILGFVAKCIWFVIIIGFPFALYFYILEPYFEMLGSNFEIFKAGIVEIPGFKGLEKLFFDVGL
jgi:hypothetical protein